MQILKITPLDNKRSKIVLDNGSAFALYKGEIRSIDLQEGGEVSPAQYDEIHNEILLKRAKRRILYLLGKMDRTESQIRQKLQQGHYPEDIIEESIAYAKSRHYLDDARYAQNYVRIHKEKKSHGKMRMDLLSKGVHWELADQALEIECPQENEQELILKWAQKKKYSPKTATFQEKQRFYRFLLRKGFHSDDILHVLDYLT